MVDGWTDGQITKQQNKRERSSPGMYFSGVEVRVFVCVCLCVMCSLSRAIYTSRFHPLWDQ